MLIKDLKQHFKTPLKGAIHIGAHHGQEKNWYDENNITPIVWIDANPEYENILKNRYPDDIVIISGVGSENKVDKFKIANNGESSSFLNFATHEKEHPHVKFIDEIQVNIKKMSDIIKENSINIENYNFLNVDVQGYELEVFKGFENYLSYFDYVYCEVNEDLLYENCSLISEIDSYLSLFNFERVETFMTVHKWGDALYIKK
jgi:FkbM family methyltransferase